MFNGIFQKERPQESLKVLCLTFSLSVVSAMLYDLRWCTLCVIKYCCFYIALYKRWRLLSHSMIVSDIRFMFESWHYKLIFFSRAFFSIFWWSKFIYFKAFFITFKLFSFIFIKLDSFCLEIKILNISNNFFWNYIDIN